VETNRYLKVRTRVLNGTLEFGKRVEKYSLIRTPACENVESIQKEQNNENLPIHRSPISAKRCLQVHTTKYILLRGLFMCCTEASQATRSKFKVKHKKTSTKASLSCAMRLTFQSL
jgi:hypothetical protein